MPTNEHSLVARNIIVALAPLEIGFPLYVRPELRMRLPERRYRLADVSIFAHEKPSASIPPEIPYGVVEIVSPDDRYDDILTKLDEYSRWGVAHVWLIDPARRQILVYRDGELARTGALELPEFGEAIPAEQVFQGL